MSFVPTILLIIVCIAHDNRRNFVVFFLSLYHRASEMATLAATPTGGTPPKEVVAITGSAGFIGSLLTEAFKREGYAVVGIDRAVPTSQHTSDEKAGFGVQKGNVDRVVDIADPKACEGMFAGCNLVIHLAGDGNPSADFLASLVPNNIIAMHNVCKEAQASKVRRVIFASTNHTQIYGFEQMNATKPSFAGKFHGAEHVGTVNTSTPDCPSSLYGVSKIMGEQMGNFFAVREKAFEFIGLRIGWVVYDDANAHKGTPLNDYLQSMFLSKEDCIGYFLAAARTTRIDKFFVGYAVSNNSTRLYDYEDTCRVLNFYPADYSGRLETIR